MNWWERSFWEPTVALAIRDHYGPGNVVCDVGAMALIMSRLVGTRGTSLLVIGLSGQVGDGRVRGPANGLGFLPI